MDSLEIKLQNVHDDDHGLSSLCDEALTEIQQLRAKIGRLRLKLKYELGTLDDYIEDAERWRKHGHTLIHLLEQCVHLLDSPLPLECPGLCNQVRTTIKAAREG